MLLEQWFLEEALLGRHHSAQQDRKKALEFVSELQLMSS